MDSKNFCSPLIYNRKASFPNFTHINSLLSMYIYGFLLIVILFCKEYCTNKCLLNTRCWRLSDMELVVDVTVLIFLLVVVVNLYFPCTKCLFPNLNCWFSGFLRDGRIIKSFRKGRVRRLLRVHVDLGRIRQQNSSHKFKVSSFRQLIYALIQFRFPSFLYLALGQMAATILVLFVGERCHIVSFPRCDRTLPRRIFPLPIFYLLNLVSGLGGTQKLK